MPDYLTCITHSESPENMIRDYIGVLEEAGYRGRIKIAFDEWNLRGWHHPGFPRKTVQDYNDPEVKRLVGTLRMMIDHWPWRGAAAYSRAPWRRSWRRAPPGGGV